MHNLQSVKHCTHVKFNAIAVFSHTEGAIRLIDIYLINLFEKN